MSGWLMFSGQGWSSSGRFLLEICLGLFPQGDCWWMSFFARQPYILRSIPERAGGRAGIAWDGSQGGTMVLVCAPAEFSLLQFLRAVGLRRFPTAVVETLLATSLPAAYGMVARETSQAPSLRRVLEIVSE
jgi:hypothetical protein